MRTFTREQLMEILELHRKWISNENGGERANLSDANLSYANLSDASLSYANLIDANLSDADLIGADLIGADLSGADLRSANLRSANLSDADLSYANLRSANLIDANLIDANLSYANLIDANLSDAKEDLFEILNSAPKEVPGLLEALKEGRVNGSTYTGECCCLVGTIANVRGCDYRELDGITPYSDRPAEKWFLAIREGDTPGNSVVSKLTVEWVEEWTTQQSEEEQTHA